MEPPLPELEVLTKVAYSLRIDASFNLFEPGVDSKNDALDIILGSFDQYLFAKEHKQDGTEHLQGIVFCSEKMGQHDLNTLRSKIRLKLVSPARRNAKNSYSLKLSKKPESLIKYCNDKEGNGVITNLSDGVMKKIGKWEDLDLTKKDKKFAWNKFLKEIADQTTVTGSIFAGLERKAWTLRLIEGYFEIYESLPRALTVEKCLYTYKSTPGQRHQMVVAKYSNIFENINFVATNYTEHNQTDDDLFNF